MPSFEFSRLILIASQVLFVVYFSIGCNRTNQSVEKEFSDSDLPVMRETQPDIPAFGVPLIRGLSTLTETERSLIGKNVFAKEDAKVVSGNAKIESTGVPWPSEVQYVKGDHLWIGVGWVQQSDVMVLEEAFDYWNNEATRNPKNVLALRKRSRCWELKNEKSIALKDLDDAKKFAPQNVDVLASRARLLTDLNRFQEAREEIDAAIQLQVNVAWLYRTRSRVKLLSADTDGAMQDVDRALALDPTDVWTHFARADVFLANSKIDDARNEYDEAIRLSPTFSDSYLRRGGVAMNAGNHQEALFNFNLAIQVNPNDPRARVIRGRCFAEIDDLNSALRDLDEAIRIGKNDFRPYEVRADIRISTGDLNGAIEDFESASRLAAGNPSLHSYLKQIRDAKKKIDSLTEQLHRDGRNVKLLLDRAITKMNISYNRGASEDVERAIELDPTYAWAYCERAGLYERSKEFELAERFYGKAIRLEPAQTVFLYRRKLLRFRRNDVKGQIADCEALMKLKPDDSDLKHEHAYLLREDGRHKDSIEEFDAFLEIDPDYSPAYFNRAIAKFHIGDREGAIRDFDRAKTLGNSAVESKKEELGILQ